MSPQKLSESVPPAKPLSADDLLDRYRKVRAFTESLCAPLEVEDYVVQTMPDVSPTKWHLAHTAWFFETFVLKPHAAGYRPINPHYEVLFNSYYNAVGEAFSRPQRGLLSRPTVKDVLEYRSHVDVHVTDLVSTADSELLAQVGPILEIGLHHEQQHQELLLTDIKHVLGFNPLRPVYHERKPRPQTKPVSSLEWLTFAEATYLVGHDGRGFAYDNELPRHRALVHGFRLASRLVTNGEYRRFMGDGGYRRPELWLSDGWATVNERGWRAPLYWEERDGQWWMFTLDGMHPIDDDAPVCHVSLFEADAFARWAGHRLPTEFEWEVATGQEPIDGNFVDDDHLHPMPATSRQWSGRIQQLFGDVWEWTMSQYSPYPGYRPPEGAIGEYNGKFMCNQFVLRGGSCATSRDHIRRTYRNFFPPDARWQFSGIRLADET